MSEKILNTRALPETLFRLIQTEKVALREEKGEIRLIPIQEPVKENLNAKAWREFISELRNCDEELTPEFDEIVGQRVNFARDIDL
ncbi:MAG: hypothetical protein FWF88_04415 [Peptococcaceae bacterium]|nr:hypothetical protein [Peptococcaceae bacterium]